MTKTKKHYDQTGLPSIYWIYFFLKKSCGWICFCKNIFLMLREDTKELGLWFVSLRMCQWGWDAFNYAWVSPLPTRHEWVWFAFQARELPTIPPSPWSPISDQVTLGLWRKHSVAMLGTAGCFMILHSFSRTDKVEIKLNEMRNCRTLKHSVDIINLQNNMRDVWGHEGNWIRPRPPELLHKSGQEGQAKGWVCLIWDLSLGRETSSWLYALAQCTDTFVTHHGWGWHNIVSSCTTPKREHRCRFLSFFPQAKH